MSSPVARALRDNHVVEVDSKDLVPGDIVLLEAGDVVPADMRLLEANSSKSKRQLLQVSLYQLIKICQQFWLKMHQSRPCQHGLPKL